MGQWSACYGDSSGESQNADLHSPLPGGAGYGTYTDVDRCKKTIHERLGELDLTSSTMAPFTSLLAFGTVALASTLRPRQDSSNTAYVDFSQNTGDPQHLAAGFIYGIPGGLYVAIH